MHGRKKPWKSSSRCTKINITNGLRTTRTWFFLGGDNPKHQVSWSAASNRVPTLRMNAGKLWIASKHRWPLGSTSIWRVFLVDRFDVSTLQRWKNQDDASGEVGNTRNACLPISIIGDGRAAVADLRPASRIHDCGQLHAFLLHQCDPDDCTHMLCICPVRPSWKAHATFAICAGTSY